MVHFFRRRQFSGLLALLAQRMCHDVSGADALPVSAIALVVIRIALVLVVVEICLLLVLITESLVRQYRAARITTGSLGSGWHGVSPSASWQSKSPQSFVLRRLLVIAGSLLPMSLFAFDHFFTDSILKKAYRASYTRNCFSRFVLSSPCRAG